MLLMMGPSGVHGVALRDQADARPEPNLRGVRGKKAERGERLHHSAPEARESTVLRVGVLGLVIFEYDAVLRNPNCVEAPLLDGPRLRRNGFGRRRFGDREKDADFHKVSPSSVARSMCGGASYLR